MNAGEHRKSCRSIFVKGSGAVANNPAVNRVFVRFKDTGGNVRGATSVAVKTQ